MSLRNVQKLYEMGSLSQSPAPPRGTLGAASTPPVFTDSAGNPISAIVCGGAYTFDVPGAGMDHVWLILNKNGSQVFNAIIPIPIPYTSVCSTDVGTYQALAYDPNSGALLGQVTFQVLPASAGPAGQTTPAGTGLSLNFLSNLTPTEMLIGGAVILFLLGGKK